MQISKTTPRHRIPYGKIPPGIRADDYTAILDCVFEMADDIMTGNGWTADKSVDTVLRDERWRILPMHRKEIIRRLTAKAG